MISSYEGNVNVDEFHNPMKFNSMDEITQMNFDDTFEIDHLDGFEPLWLNFVTWVTLMT
jgi:hypothetical protein